MSWGLVIAGGATLISTGLQVQAGKKAAGAAKGASDASIAESQRQFDLVRSDTAGLRHTGNAALDRINRLYGYGPAPTAEIGGYSSGSPFSAAMPRSTVPGGSANIGGTLTTKLGGVGKILDPAAAIFGSKHGDERRNLKAFLADNKLRDLGDGTVALPDGRTFTKDQLGAVAGAYYGARYHPDGDQEGWQAKYDAALTAAPQPAGADSAGAAAPAGPDMSAFFESPDYQFRLGETQKALDRIGAARGRYDSGVARKEGARYASNLASGEYASFYDRLAQQAGLGVTGIGASANAGANTAGLVTNANLVSGNARANSYLNTGAAIGSGVDNIASNYLLSQYLKQRPIAVGA